MSKLRVCSFGLSLDGYGAGPEQSREHPLGVGGEALHKWAFATRFFRAMHGQEGGETGVDDRMIAEGFENIGAWIIGRNMFGPTRGQWESPPWRGWWGENPPFKVPVFVLTHYPREPLIMQGGTEFHFETDGIHAALDRARHAADGREVRLGGGPGVIRDYMRAGLIADMHLAIAPVLLGRGENLFRDLDAASLGYRCSHTIAGEAATHVFITRASVSSGEEPVQQ